MKPRTRKATVGGTIPGPTGTLPQLSEKRPPIENTGHLRLEVIVTSRGTWVAQLVEHPTSAQVTISRFADLSPASGSVLIACSEPGPCFGLCLLLSLPLPHSRFVSLRFSKINVKKKLSLLFRGTS